MLTPHTHRETDKEGVSVAAAALALVLLPRLTTVNGRAERSHGCRSQKGQISLSLPSSLLLPLPLLTRPNPTLGHETANKDGWRKSRPRTACDLVLLKKRVVTGKSGVLNQKPMALFAYPESVRDETRRVQVQFLVINRQKSES